jgi:hypothetical protein
MIKKRAKPLQIPAPPAPPTPSMTPETAPRSVEELAQIGRFRLKHLFMQLTPGELPKETHAAIISMRAEDLAKLVLAKLKRRDKRPADDFLTKVLDLAQGLGTVEISNGIVKLHLDDDSYWDFTLPRHFTEKP